MKIKASLLAGLVASAPFAFAQDVEVATDPVGYVSVNLLAASDTRVSVPMHRAPVFQGIPVSVNGTSINFAEGTGIQPEAPAYFIAVRSGALAGTRATVVATDNGGDTLIIDEGVDLSGLATGENGDAVQVIPHWTVSTLLGSDFDDGTQLLVWDGNTEGVNIASSAVYEFNGENWMDGPFVNVNDNVIHQGESFIVRTASGDDASLVIAGSVPMVPHLTQFSTLASNTTQDAYVAISVPTPTSLADSNLAIEAGFQLLVPANNSTGINKAADSVFEYNGTSWMDGPFVNVDDYELQPGVGYIVRLPGTAEPTDYAWSFTPSYLSEE